MGGARRSVNVTQDENAESVEFGYRGVQYRARLSASQADKLDRLMATYIEAGRAVPARGSRMRGVK
jgi:hypothetical protein